jgi:thiol-disulfide isomerase/thioredoxin
MTYSSECTRWRSLCWMFLAILPCLVSSLHMSYKPPVHPSVSKIRSSRLSMLNNPETQQAPARRSSTQQAAAASNLVTSTTTSSSSPTSSSFEGRMRGLVFGRRSKQEQQKNRILPPNVFTVETLQDYKRVVGEESSKLVCVRFFAPWCKACKAVQPLFYHMANTFPNVVFVDVPVTSKNTNLHQGLGVPSLPYGHIYHPTGGLVEELRLTRRCIPKTALKLQHYVKGSCDLEGVGDVTCPYKPLDTES